MDVPLRRRGVPVLDDTDGATALADHPTIARGIRQLGGEERGRRARLSVVLDERLDHVLRHEGLIARQDEDRALAAGAMSLEHRVSGAEALLLLDVGEILRVSHRGPDLGSAVPDDEDHASAEGATQPHRIVDERATGHAVECAVRMRRIVAEGVPPRHRCLQRRRSGHGNGLMLDAVARRGEADRAVDDRPGGLRPSDAHGRHAARHVEDQRGRR